MHLREPRHLQDAQECEGRTIWYRTKMTQPWREPNTAQDQVRDTG